MPDQDVTPILNRINTPGDLKKLSIPQLNKLAAEIRAEIIDVVSKNGGHLAPNLGAVELTIALHYVFDAPRDKLVWDVGHQGYVHKLLTGRREFFKTLRQDEGCLGFLSPAESEYDVFGAGHAGTAISAALGLAAARDQLGGKEKVVAVVGDGALTCGISLEGLNNVAATTRDMIIVLNDNKMSISQNVGAITNYLNNIISGRGYNRFKAFAKMMLKKIPHGDDIRRAIARFEEATKSLFVPGVIFEELGLRYVGPIDGHNFNELIRVLGGVREFRKPTIVHVITEKGRGYQYAVDAPEKFHGLSSFNPRNGVEDKDGRAITFSEAFGRSLVELAESHPEVVAITAAMAHGTGLAGFAERFPARFYDTGISEEHAMVFAAGLAAAGLRPVIAVYATFLQRALDCVFHDVCLQNLPVLICTDRAGVVEDGPTHHGIQDLGFLRALPNLAILAPKDENELRAMLFASHQRRQPVNIRYPRGGTGRPFRQKQAPAFVAWGEAELVSEGSDLAIWAVGREVYTALEVAELLKKTDGKKVAVVNTRFLRPFDEKLLIAQAEHQPIVTIEDAIITGGLAGVADEILINKPHHRVLHFGWNTQIIPHGTIAGIRTRLGFTPEAMAAKIRKYIFAPCSVPDKSIPQT